MSDSAVQINTRLLKSLFSNDSITTLLTANAVGTSIWVTFFAGPIQYYTLPREQFGNLQSKQFPAFFAVQAGSSLALLGMWLQSRSFPKVFSLRDANTFNAVLLIAGLTSALANLGYAGPVATEIMRTRHRLQKVENTTYDAEIKSPQMIALNKRFAIAHSVSSLLNLVTLGALSLSAVLVGSIA